MAYRNILFIISTMIFGCMSVTSCNEDEEAPASGEIISAINQSHPDAVISIGIEEDGYTEMYIIRGGKKEEYKEYKYQIGSITKTFTSAMCALLMLEKRVDINEGNPSLLSLMTHHSGLSDEWEKALELNMDTTFSRQALLDKAASVAEVKNAPFCYSNLGSAVAATRIASVYAQCFELADTSYQNCMNHYIRQELQMKHTKVGGKGDFGNDWNWKDGDEMLAARGITSCVSDLLHYARLYQIKEAYLQKAIQPLAQIDADYQIGIFWTIDKENGYIWHNGEVTMDDSQGEEVGYQSFLGFDPSNGRSVVVLSNVIANDEDGDAYTDILGYLLLQGR